MWNQACLVPDDLQVLARGMEDLHHALVGHQLEEGRKIDARGERVDDSLLAGSRKLNDAQLGPERLLANELGVDSDKTVLAETTAEVAQLRGRCDETHGRARYNRNFRATQSLRRPAARVASFACSESSLSCLVAPPHGQPASTARALARSLASPREDDEVGAGTGFAARAVI